MHFQIVCRYGYSNSFLQRILPATTSPFRLLNSQYILFGSLRFGHTVSRSEYQSHNIKVTVSRSHYQGHSIEVKPEEVTGIGIIWI